jgi:hypothetical protein
MSSALVTPCASSAIRLGPPLADDVFRVIRREMELSHFKWDAQVGDVTSLARFPLLIDPATWRELAELAEMLATETLAVEAELFGRPELHETIGLPRPLQRLFVRGAPTPAAARVMRFDFHPTAEGWRVSEVNGDVPGGFTEATNFARLVAREVPGAVPPGDPTQALIDALLESVPHDGTVALICAPGHLEDHQVIAHLAARIRDRGLSASLVSPQGLSWSGGRSSVDAIVRFYQAEWLARLPHSTGWAKLFTDGRTPVVNPGTAALIESKRLALVWDRLRVRLPTWRQLLPETRALADAPWTTDDGWLLKSAYCNTGDTVSMRSEMDRASWRRVVWSARLRPSNWLAQRRFEVTPVVHEDARFFPCIGVYTVNQKAAGAYARVARGPIVDYRALDAALLVCSGA